jgi:hypothetical protein
VPVVWVGAPRSLGGIGEPTSGVPVGWGRYAEELGWHW